MVKKKIRKLFIILFFVLIFIIGIIRIEDYGVSLDQSTENEILFMNLKAYGQLLLGNDSGYATGLTERDVFTDKERDHGAAALYILMPFTLLGYFRNNPTAWIFVYRLACLAIFEMGLIALFALIKTLTGRKSVAVLIVLIAWLSPRFFAESVYNNKDIVCFSLTLVTFYLGYEFLSGQKNEYVWSLIFGVVTAITTNMRVTGVVFFIVVGGVYLFYHAMQRSLTFVTLLRGIVALISFLLFYYLLTPGMWHGILEYLQYVLHNSADFNRCETYILEAGELYHTTIKPAGIFYLPVYMLVTIPPLFIVLFVIGLIKETSLAFKCKGEKSYRYLFTIIIVIYIVGIGTIILFTKPVLYNGWRHMYFLYAPVLVLIAMAIDYLTGVNKILSVVTQSLILMQLIILIIFIVTNYPNEFSYYNFFAGSQVEEKFDGDWWGISLRPLLEKLSTEYGESSVVLRENEFLNATLPYCSEETQKNISVAWYTDADLVLVNEEQRQHLIKGAEEDWSPYTESDAKFWKDLYDYEPLMIVKSGNEILWYVYENPLKD